MVDGRRFYAGEGIFVHGKPKQQHQLTCNCADTGEAHRFGLCCSRWCWCNQAPVKIKSQSSGPDGAIVHEPHPECDRAGWHPKAECPCFLDETGKLGRAVNVEPPYCPSARPKKRRVR